MLEKSTDTSLDFPERFGPERRSAVVLGGSWWPRMGHEKPKESILVEIPRTSRTFRQAFEGMEATKNFLPLSVSAGSKFHFIH